MMCCRLGAVGYARADASATLDCGGHVQVLLSCSHVFHKQCLESFERWGVVAAGAAAVACRIADVVVPRSGAQVCPSHAAHVPAMSQSQLREEANDTRHEDAPAEVCGSAPGVCVCVGVLCPRLVSACACVTVCLCVCARRPSPPPATACASVTHCEPRTRVAGARARVSAAQEVPGDAANSACMW